MWTIDIMEQQPHKYSLVQKIDVDCAISGTHTARLYNRIYDNHNFLVFGIENDSYVFVDVLDCQNPKSLLRELYLQFLETAEKERNGTV